MSKLEILHARFCDYCFAFKGNTQATIRWYKEALHFLNGPPRLAYLRQPALAPGQSVGDFEARFRRAFGLLRELHERVHFLFDPRLELFRVGVADRLVLRGVGLDFGAVHRDVANVEDSYFRRRQQHLPEKVFDVIFEPIAQRIDGVVVGVQVPGDEAKDNQIKRRPLYLSGAEYPGRIGIEQEA